MTRWWAKNCGYRYGNVGVATQPLCTPGKLRINALNTWRKAQGIAQRPEQVAGLPRIIGKL